MDACTPQNPSKAAPPDPPSAPRQANRHAKKFLDFRNTIFKNNSKVPPPDQASGLIAMTPTSTQPVGVLNQPGGSNSSNQDSISIENLPTSDEAHIDETSSFNTTTSSGISTASDPAKSLSTVALADDEERIGTRKMPTIKTSYSQPRSTAGSTLGEETANSSPECIPPRDLSSSPYEPPLQRPKDDLTPSPTPSNAAPQATIELSSSIPFTDQKVAFAVDVSGSTKGPVLQQERAVIETISRQLSNTADQAKVLPWSRSALPILHLDELDQLQARSGTRPTVLNSAPQFAKELKECTSWFLLTDGQIDEYEGKRFALGICENEYHGTACVIILFGYKARRPINCDVSVGLAVFASTPDCLFLFHDVDTRDVYVLQSKGVFNAVLPRHCQELLLNEQTVWSDLPRIFYEQLSTIRIPRPRSLKANEISFQSGKTLCIEALHYNTVDPNLADEILGNDDNLKSLLLSAGIRGLEKDVEGWIGRQQLQAKDPLHMTRPIGQALRYTKDLLECFRRGTPAKELEMLQSHLRIAHRANWTSLYNTIQSNQEAVMERSNIVEDAITRIDLNRHNYRAGSPATLSPVSTRRSADSSRTSYSPGYLPPSTREPYARPQYFPENYVSGPDAPRYAPVHAPIASFYGYQNQAPQATTRRSILGVGSSNPQWPNVLYTKGYQYDRLSNSGFLGRCAFCCEENAVLALLIKRPPEDEKSDNFPEPNTSTRTKYPFVMGGYPETDILSSYVCCDPCSYFLVLAGESPYGEPLVGAIPLISSICMDGASKVKAVETINMSLCNRFDKPTVPTIFLAILYNTLQQGMERVSTAAQGEILAQQINSMQWFGSQMARHAYVLKNDPCFGSLLAGYSASYQISLSVALGNIFSGYPEIDNSLMGYPLSGFVVLMYYVKLLNLDFGHGQFVAFQRLLFHLLEQHHEILASGQVDVAILELSEVLKSAEHVSTNSGPNYHNFGSGIAFSNSTTSILRSLPNHLLPEDLEIFQSLGSIYDFIDEHCKTALVVFLAYLYTIDTNDCDWTESFKRLREHKDLGCIVKAPETISPQLGFTLVSGVMPQCVEDKTGKILGPFLTRRQGGGPVPMWEDAIGRQYEPYRHIMKHRILALFSDSNKNDNRDGVAKEAEGKTNVENKTNGQCAGRVEECDEVDELDELEDSKFA